MTGKIFALMLAASMAFATVGIAGCNSDNGPAEQAGQKVDKMMGNEGPAQKAGEKVDQAGKNISDAAKDVTDGDN